jgi:hypothetical protein
MKDALDAELVPDASSRQDTKVNEEEGAIK